MNESRVFPFLRSPLQVIVGRLFRLAATQAAASSPFPAFLLHARSSGGTRAAVNVLLLKNHSNGCWTPFSSNFSDLQPVLALRRLPLTEIPLTSLSDADVLVSTKATHNAAIKCTALDAISSVCKMRSKHSGNYRGNFGKKRENQMNKEWEQSSK